MKRSIIILSGACCYPSFKSLDLQVRNVMKEAARQTGIEVILKTVSIASVALGGFGGFGERLGAAIASLINLNGIGVLPLVIIDGEIKFYSKIPNFEEACQQLK